MGLFDVDTLVRLGTSIAADKQVQQSFASLVFDEETVKRLITGLLIGGVVYLNHLSVDDGVRLYKIVEDAKKNKKNTYNLTQDEIDGAYKLFHSR